MAFSELTLHRWRPTHVAVQDAPIAPRNQPLGSDTLGAVEIVRTFKVVGGEVEVEVVVAREMATNPCPLASVRLWHCPSVIQSAASR